IDLGHMGRFWTVFKNRNLWSVLEIEIHFYVLYIAVLLAELWLLMRRDLVRCGRGSGWQARWCRLLALGQRDTSDKSGARDRRIVAILGAIGIPIAIGVHGGTGAIFAVIKARPMWYGPLFPIIFLVSALASGGALLTFLLAFFAGRSLEVERRDDLVRTLGRMTAGLLAIDLLLIFSEFSVGVYGGIPEHVEALRLIMFGPFWWVFWFVQILFGAVVPLAVMLLPSTRENPRWIGLAGLMAVIGIFGVRMNIVIPALSLPILPGMDRAYNMLPAPTEAFTSYPAAALAWLDGLAFMAAAVTLAAFGYAGVRRARGSRGAGAGQPVERFLVTTGLTAAVLLVGFLALRWTGTSTHLGLAATGLDLTRTPIGGILGHTELRSYYIPSPNEWLSSAGIIGLAIVTFAAGYRSLPLEAQES
ncbi:MAG: NrfD/PsrC family molybdoenzyme membrane anchor subunit, partial [Anaerolineae bacterium]